MTFIARKCGFTKIYFGTSISKIVFSGNNVCTAFFIKEKAQFK